MVDVGQAAPNFTLPNQDGQSVSLSQFKGSPVVLYFYPKDATPGCTTEACDFRDAHPDYEKLGVKVLGVSPDDVKSHKKFADKQSLPFTLLADTEHSVAEAYGVWVEKSMYGKKYMGIERTTFVIGKNGKVTRVFPKVKVNGHVAEVLDVIKSL